MIKSEACYVTSQMKSLGFPTVVRVSCPVAFKIILSLAHAVFTKTGCRLLNTEASAIHYSISTVLSQLITKSSFGEKSERSL